MRKKEKSVLFGDEPINKYVSVTGHKVNVRSAPGMGFQIFGTVVAGETLTYYDTVMDERGDDWYEVNFDGKHGYICGKFSKIVSDDNEVG